MFIVSCAACDEKFQPKKAGQETCSRPCRSKIRYQRKKADGTGYIPKGATGSRGSSTEHEKSCTECGTSFVGAAIQTYCGGKCKARVKERNRIASGYYQRPEVIERRNKIARAKYKPREPKAFEAILATCPHCGASFTKTHPHKRYCTDTCVESARNERKRKAPEPKPCKACGNDYIATRTMQYCSLPCRKKINRQIEREKKRSAPKRPRKAYEPKSYPATCTYCQELYEARSQKSKYCGQKCRYEANAAATGKRDCRRCTAPLADTHYARYCQPCQILNKRDARATYRGQQNNRCRNHKKRAEFYGVPYEPFKRTDIYERDGWRCGICTKRIDQDLAYPHPMSVSLDHIVPLSKGGGHLRDNVQAAHLKCNVHKGAAADYVQPLLIG